MARKNSAVSVEDGATLLTESEGFDTASVEESENGTEQSAIVSAIQSLSPEEAAKAIKALRAMKKGAKAPKEPKTPKEKVVKAPKTLEDVVAQQEANPFLWIVRNILEKADQRMAVATENDHYSMEQALSDIASFYAQLGANARSLSEAAGVKETSTQSVARLVEVDYPHRLAQLGKVYGQPAKPAPYTRGHDEAFLVNGEGEPEE